jgi:hypothetical protein
MLVGLPKARVRLWRKAGLCSRTRIRKEELLPVDLVAGNSLLACAARQPVYESLSFFGLHPRVLLRIDQYDAVLIEKLRVTLDQDLEIILVDEAQPGAAVGERISMFTDGGVKRRAHARASFQIPIATCMYWINVRLLP